MKNDGVKMLLFSNWSENGTYCRFEVNFTDKQPLFTTTAVFTYIKLIQIFGKINKNSLK
jgi:hypothetical protein